MTKFDPKDPQYQVSNQFQPDKETSWPFPAERDGWVLAHNCLRGEIQIVKETLLSLQMRDQQLNQKELQTIQKVMAIHLEHVHAHHTNEDDIFVPELNKRFHYPKKLETDHEGLVRMLDDIEKCTGELKVGDKVTMLLQMWLEYESSMLPHLKEEEEIGLPLYRAYFTPEEGAVLVQKVLQKSAKYETGSFIYFDSVNRFRSEFMKQEKIPGFVWYMVFRGKYRQYIRDFINPLEALKKNRQNLINL